MKQLPKYKGIYHDLIRQDTVEVVVVLDEGKQTGYLYLKTAPDNRVKVVVNAGPYTGVLRLCRADKKVQVRVNNPGAFVRHGWGFRSEVLAFMGENDNG